MRSRCRVKDSAQGSSGAKPESVGVVEYCLPGAPFINTLSFYFPVLTTLGAFCIRGGFNRPPIENAALEEATMHLTISQCLFLIPVALSLAFMLWVLWSVTRQLDLRNQSAGKQKLISIRVGDGYALDIQPHHVSRHQIAARSARISGPGTTYRYGTERDSSRSSAPVLGFGLRGMSSTAIRGERN